MDFKAFLSIENMSTLLAGERALSSMNSHVGIEVLAFFFFFFCEDVFSVCEQLIDFPSVLKSVFLILIFLSCFIQ